MPRTISIRPPSTRAASIDVAASWPGGNGGCSSAGRAPGCDPGCRGFESRQPPRRSEGVCLSSGGLVGDSCALSAPLVGLRFGGKSVVARDEYALHICCCEARSTRTRQPRALPSRLAAANAAMTANYAGLPPTTRQPRAATGPRSAQHHRLKMLVHKASRLRGRSEARHRLLLSGCPSATSPN